MHQADNNPFFIVGSDRSGTTLLRLMLNKHPRLCVPEESWFIPPIMDQFSADRRLGPDDLQNILTIITSHTCWNRLWGEKVTSSKLKDVLFKLDKPTVSEAIDAVFRYANNPAKKPRWGDKTPPYIREIPRLHKFFPASKFIHIVRDGRDVSISLRKVKWHGPTTLHAALYWKEVVDLGLRSAKALGPDLYLQIRYEDLVLKTEETLHEICNFLTEDFAWEMLSFYKDAAQEVALARRRARAKGQRPPRPTDVERWHAEMSALQVAVFELIAGGALDCLGYQRRYPRWAVPPILSKFITILAAQARPLRARLQRRYPMLRKRI
jgi:hypothetical protein